ncbi:MAG: type III restriction endonuclease subunit R, partial [Inhella sp.]
RLPYGKRTGVEAVDRLNIIAHDRFQEIIDDANRSDSPIRLKTLILDAPDSSGTGMQSVTVTPSLLGDLGVNSPDASNPLMRSMAPAAPLFTSEREQAAVMAVMEAVAQYETRRDEAPTRQALLRPDIQAAIAQAVQERLPPEQLDLVGDDTAASTTLDVADVVQRTLEAVLRKTIDIPRIVVVPQGEVSSGFRPFKVDVSGLHLQPKDRSLVLQNLRTNQQSTLSAQQGPRERRLEDYIVHKLIDFDDIDYNTHAELLYDLAGQVVEHLRSYLRDEDEVRNVLDLDRQLIADNLHAQMAVHHYDAAQSYVADVRRGFTALKAPTFTVGSGEVVRNYRDTVDDSSRIKQMVFGHFSKCLYPLQKFDSGTELRFAKILERDAEKWFKPVKGQFQIYYRDGAKHPEYIPDFVVETEAAVLMVETKARNELEATDVKAKAEAGATWCRHASDHAKTAGGKPWKYLLVPHDVVTEDKRLVDFQTLT